MFKKLLGGLLLGGKGDSNPLKNLTGSAGELAEIFTVSDKEKASHYRDETERLRVQQATHIQELRHPSMFVAGGRPAIVWVLAAGLAVNFVAIPVLENGIILAQWIIDGMIGTPEFALLDVEELIVAGSTVLGMGGLRSFEKSKGVARDNLK